MINLQCCATVLRESLFIQPNLTPDVGDVDLGQENAAAMPNRVKDFEFDVPVRINVGNQPIGAVDLYNFF